MSYPDPQHGVNAVSISESQSQDLETKPQEGMRKK